MLCAVLQSTHNDCLGKATVCRFTMRNGEACFWALKLKTKNSAVPAVKEMFTGSGSVDLLDEMKHKFWLLFLL